jgi:ABC-type Fe3+/spermidine/putrescine transport system ATPase subunit
MATRSEADILLVDEVLAVGDADFQRKCFEFFRQLKKNKKTVIFVTHDMNAVREYCDEAMLIDSSQVKFAGPAEDVAKEYSRLFIPQEDTNTDEKADKWGNGGVNMSTIQVSDKLIDENDEYIKVTVLTDILNVFENGLVAGLTIKNEAGQAVCGTNSKIIRSKTFIPESGSKVRFTWSIPNIFNEGRYTMDFAIIDSTNNDICQWIDNAISIRVINKSSTPYIVAPKILLKTDELTR